MFAFTWWHHVRSFSMWPLSRWRYVQETELKLASYRFDSIRQMALQVVPKSTQISFLFAVYPTLTFPGLTANFRWSYDPDMSSSNCQLQIKLWQLCEAVIWSWQLDLEELQGDLPLSFAIPLNVFCVQSCLFVKDTITVLKYIPGDF